MCPPSMPTKRKSRERENNMNILESPLITRVERLCADAYRRNFHERNGGNISYRLSETDVASLKSGFVPSRTYPTGVTVKDLADEYFLVTATGKFLGNVPYEPEIGLGIIQISHDGTEYTIMTTPSTSRHITPASTAFKAMTSPSAKRRMR